MTLNKPELRLSDFQHTILTGALHTHMHVFTLDLFI